MFETFLAVYLPLIISGHYTTWVFNVIFVQGSLFVVNNFALLWLIAISWQKFAAKTAATWDDKASNWFVNWLSKRNPNKPIPKPNQPGTIKPNIKQRPDKPYEVKQK